MPAQLDLFGQQVGAPIVTRHAGFTRAQREILRVVGRTGSIRSVEAGRILHAHRYPPCRRCAGTCPWASTDGNDALKRLMARGFVQRASPGVWISAG